MDSSSTSSKGFFKTACYFEISLLFLAVVIGWMTDINPFQDIYFSEIAVFYGLIGTLPLILMYFFTDKLPFDAIKRVKKILLDTLGENLQHCHWTDLLVLATITGISEEVLFRGVLQPWLEQSLGAAIGLMVSSLIFGLIHAVTPLYGLLATLMSYYLGISLDFTETRNLLTPILIHTFYDFFAFILLMRTFSKISHDK